MPRVWTNHVADLNPRQLDAGLTAERDEWGNDESILDDTDAEFEEWMSFQVEDDD